MISSHFVLLSSVLFVHVHFIISQDNSHEDSSDRVAQQLPHNLSSAEQTGVELSINNVSNLVEAKINGLDNLPVRFFLYTNTSNPNASQELLLNDEESLKNSDFQNGKPIKVIIHGFISNETSFFPQNVKDAYLKENNGTISRNIINVDWGQISNINTSNPILISASYPAAVNQIPKVGAQVAQLLAYFLDNNRTSFNLIHIIGHSLGAHVSGAAGDSMHTKYGEKIPRITGLDPAGPLFYTYTVGRPLTKVDAKFVDIIHTDQGAFGKYGQIGHVDFFPNGGTFVQHGCRGNVSFIEIDPVLDLLTVGGYCSHSESHRLYAKSIGTTTIKGCKCFFFAGNICHCRRNAPKAVFGDNCSPTYQSGNYYLDMGRYLN